MAQSSYNIKDVYKEINTIDGYFGEKDGGNGGRVEYENSSIYQYCPYSSIFNSGYCRDHFQRARSGVINLLENLEKYNLEYDKLAEYAILFLSYKLKQHSQHKYKSAKLDHFYTNHIEKNEHYNKIKVNGLTCKEIIDKKKDLMNTNEISKFNVLFSILFSFYNGINKNNLDCNKCSKDANEFVQNFEKLNEDSNINGNISYSRLLSTLSNDYDNFKIYFAEKCNDCNDLPPLPKVKTPPSKLIPALSTFSVIPVFLGIAYKVNNKELKTIIFL
ncbi:CIR protein PIR protein [Plasmodium vinckei petteri]|uniref:CIR protein PIR protein n=1 Tax=Plasmodium vinckei petteri TaxID=138298 RepID=A0A6V7TGF1_PLAVN|nr:CIR protein PIR protein [Plasmodium vinckei petteri]